MGVDIVVMLDCASNYGTFEVQGSKGKDYVVNLSGSEGPAHCNCPSFRYSGQRMTCKHIEQVYREACLYNPQWHDANPSPKLRPFSYIYDRFVDGKVCECGGPMVAVKRAV